MGFTVKRGVGIENANSSIKIITTGLSPIHYTNSVLKIDPKSRINETTKDKDLVYNGETYQVGNPKHVGSVSIEESRYYSEQFKLEMILALAHVVGNEEEELYIVTGLPSTLANNDLIKKKMVDNLLGYYEVVYKGVKRRFHIKSIFVVGQPIGTLMDINNVEGISEVEMAQETLIIDGGFGTVDIAIIEDWMVTDSFSINNCAMKDVLRKINSQLESIDPTISNEIKSVYELDFKLLEKNSIEINNKVHDVTKIKEDVYSFTVNQIMNKLKAKGINFASPSKIVLTGGENIHLLKYFKEHEILEKYAHKIRTPKEMILSNARGFYLLANAKYKKQLS